MRFFRTTFCKRWSKALTLPEVVISTAIASISIGGIMYGYVFASKRAEWSGYSMAAHAQAIQALERARAAKWDPMSSPQVDELVAANFPVQTVQMDLPISGTNVVYCTNTITISTISSSPPIKMIKVEVTWLFSLTGQIYTNTIAVYRCPQT